MRQACILVVMLKLQVLLSLLEKDYAEDLGEHLHELFVRHVLLVLIIFQAEVTQSTALRFKVSQSRLLSEKFSFRVQSNIIVN